MVDAAAYQLDGPFPVFDSYLTAKDRAHLATLHSPNQTQQWTKAKVEELLSRIRSLRSVCNAAAPINYTLPPDVLLEVFSHLEPSFEQRGKLNFLHVCRKWRHLLLRSTAFWTQVVGAFRSPGRRPDGIDLFQSFLQLTRNSPLTLTLDYVIPEVARTLVPCAFRIVSLTISVTPEGVDVVNAFFEREGMPLLEDLAISHVVGRHFNEVSHRPKLSLSRALLPRLRSLRHPPLTLDLEVSSVDQQLLQLTLIQCTCHVVCGHSSLVEQNVLFPLLQMLERCTSLLRLHLERIPMMGAMEIRTINLPVLRHLRIVNTRAGTLLSCLTIPNTCAIELASPDPDARIIDDILPPDIAQFHHLATADRVCARRVDSGGRTIHVLEAYIDGWNSLTVQCRYIASAVYQLLLPSLLRLRVLRVEEDARRIARSLGSKSGSCPCPQLEELEVVWYSSLNDHFEPADTLMRRRLWYRSGPLVLSIFCDIICDMLRDRAAAGSPLKKLHVRVPRDYVYYYEDKESWGLPVLKESMSAQLEEDLKGELIVSFMEEYGF